ncbi:MULTISPECIES: hypothetical protein [unclassified Snodgrassella]|uniref:hypothetical protein n=1 Tax=unclassified Snodgrassella TaxID=2625236 RepID=UPI0018DC267F|nr:MULTISPECIES: hypothetical protein [unclassified Snodgrassella]MBI0069006.1 hypothetical protein [Snodgrassella sp. M0110]MBI0078007.1 hypothetical protein [Snodgrassella sp. M0118]MBI0080306.1 hypothetical protein [Snodgrassella sp. M0112]
MIYKLRCGDVYPDSYWFHFKSEEISRVDLIECQEIYLKKPLIFTLNKKISKKRLLSYDYYLSDGPGFISPRLVALLENNEGFLKEVQLLDATVIINGQNHYGFKVFNPLHFLSCIDIDKSESQCLLAGTPNEIRIFNNIVFRQDITEDFWMARCLEDEVCIVISDKLRQLFIDNHIKGLNLED